MGEGTLKTMITLIDAFSPPRDTLPLQYMMAMALPSGCSVVPDIYQPSLSSETWEANNSNKRVGIFSGLFYEVVPQQKLNRWPTLGRQPLKC